MYSLKPDWQGVGVGGVARRASREINAGLRHQTNGWKIIGKPVSLRAAEWLETAMTSCGARPVRTCTLMGVASALLTRHGRLTLE